MVLKKGWSEDHWVDPSLQLRHTRPPKVQIHGLELPTFCVSYSPSPTWSNGSHLMTKSAVDHMRGSGDGIEVQRKVERVQETMSNGDRQHNSMIHLRTNLAGNDLHSRREECMRGIEVDRITFAERPRFSPLQ